MQINKFSKIIATALVVTVFAPNALALEELGTEENATNFKEELAEENISFDDLLEAEAVNEQVDEIEASEFESDVKNVSLLNNEAVTANPLGGFTDDFSWATDTDDSLATLQNGGTIATANTATTNNNFYRISNSIDMPSVKWWVQNGELKGTTTHGAGMGGRYTALIVDKACMPNLSNSFSVSADMYKSTSTRTVFGLEFAITSDVKNQGSYYFLRFDMNSNNIVLDRYSAGRVETLKSMSFQNNTNNWGSAYGSRRPFTFKASITARGKSNIIDCEVIGTTATGAKLPVFSASVIDNSDKALDLDSIIAPLGFQIRSQDNIKFSFDNISIQNLDATEFLLGDMFCNSQDVTSSFTVSGTEKVYELSDSVSVDRIKDEGSLGKVFLSKDGINFDEIDISSKDVEVTSENEYKYVKLPQAPTSNLYILTKLNKDITVSKGDKVPLYVLNRNGLSNKITITSEDDTIISVTNNQLLAIKPATVKVNCVGIYSERELTITIEGDFAKALNQLKAGNASRMETFLANEQKAFDKINEGIREQDVDKVQEGLIGNGEKSLSNSEVFDNTVFKNMNPEETIAFVRKLLSYPGNFDCRAQELVADENKIKAPFEEIYNVFLKESRAVKLDNVATVEELSQILKDNNDVLNLPINDDCYKNYEEAITQELIGKVFVNYNDFETKFFDILLMTNIKNSANAVYLLNLIETYSNFVGYDKTNYSKITDKNLFGNKFISAKANFTQLEDVKNYFDNYKEQEPAPQPTANPVYGGGGGGSSRLPANTEAKVVAKEYFEKDPASQAPAPVQLFTDVEISHWSYDAVAYMKAKKAVSGYEDGSFKPNNNITRAEFIKMMMTIFKTDEDVAKEFENPYSDLNEDEWYYNCMLKAAELGVLSGDGGKCYPDKLITREEISALVFRMIENSGQTINRNTEIVKFSDEGEISKWAYVPIMKLQTAGVLNGINGKFEPKANSTRAMAAQILYKTMTGFEKEAETNE